MKNKKILIILVLMIMSILMINVVSANETITTDTSDTNVLVNNDNNIETKSIENSVNTSTEQKQDVLDNNQSNVIKENITDNLTSNITKNTSTDKLDAGYSVVVESQTVNDPYILLMADVYYNGNHNINTGYVRFNINGDYSGYYHVSYGEVLAEYVLPKTGTYYVTAYYYNSNYSVICSGTGTINYKIIKYNSKVLLSSKTVTYGNNVTITAKITNSSGRSVGTNGYVYVYIDGRRKSTIYVYNGNVTADLGKLAKGTYTVCITYYSNNYITSGNKTKVTVNPASAKLTSNSQKVVPSTNVQIKSNITSTTGRSVGTDGYVKVYVDKVFKKSTDVKNGNISMYLGRLSMGTHKINVTYYSKNYNTASVISTITVNKSKAQINNIKSISVLPSQGVILNTTITNTSGSSVGTDGNILLYVDGKYVRTKQVTSGKSNVVVGVLSTGKHNVVLQYVSNNYDKVSKSINITVAKKTPKITNVSSKTIVTENELVLIPRITNSTNSPIITKTPVNLFINGKFVTSRQINSTGYAKFSLGKYNTGKYNVTFKFASTDYNQVSKSVNVVVNKATAKIVMNSQTFSPDTNVNMNVKITNNTGGSVGTQGSVVIYLDGRYKDTKSVNGGSVQISLGKLGLGSHSLCVRYSSARFNTVSKTVTLNIQKRTARIIMNAKSYSRNDNVVYTARIVNSTSGSVGTTGKASIYVDGNYKTTTSVISGLATFNIGKLASGSHSVSVNYSANAYASVKNTSTITITSFTAYVSTTGSDTTGTGSRAKPYQTIKKALNSIVSGDKIVLLSDVYRTLGQSGALTINKNVVISADEYSMISLGNGVSDIFIISKGASVKFKDIIFTENYRGAIFNNNGILELDNCKINTNYLSSNNDKLKKSAITNAGYLTITNSEISDNRGVFTGVITNTGTLTIESTRFAENRVVYSTSLTSQTDYNTPLFGNGGAIYNSGTLTISGSTFENNRVTVNRVRGGDAPYFGNGGAIFSEKGKVTITSTHLKSNVADFGGAIGILRGSMSISNSVIDENRAVFVGGAISTFYGEDRFTGNGYSMFTLTLLETNITYNTATESGGAIWNGGYVYAYGTINMDSCLIHSNEVTSTDSNYGNNMGAITNGGKIIIKNSIINSNTGAYGGAIYNTNDITITNSELIGNTATKNGGAIFNVGKIIIQSSYLKYNEANKGSAIYTSRGQGDGIVKISYSSLVGNDGYTIYNNDLMYTYTNVVCDDNWWGTNSLPKNKVYHCIINRYYKGDKN